MSTLLDEIIEALEAEGWTFDGVYASKDNLKLQPVECIVHIGLGALLKRRWDERIRDERVLRKLETVFQIEAPPDPTS